MGKTKAWRKAARYFNAVASIEEGTRITHQGRRNKPFIEMKPQASGLINLLLNNSARHDIFTYTLTKKQLAELQSQLSDEEKIIDEEQLNNENQ